MKIFKQLGLVMCLTLCFFTVRAQQSPMYTHYMYNTLSVNPAYAGSRNALTVTALYRAQWAGFKGAPSTQTLTLHTPIVKQHIGLGFSVINDKIGPSNNTSVSVDFAYIMRLNEKTRLALGISAGMDIFQAKLANLQLEQQNDPLYQSNINNRITANFGFGAYLYKEHFYVGISVPALLQNRYSLEKLPNGTSMVGKENRHYFFITGAVIPIANNLAFKPSMLVKVTSGAPVEADFTASFVIMKKLMVGAMYRTGDAFGGLVGLDITDQLNIGYSYDWSYRLNSTKFNFGSHELVLRYDFIFSNKTKIRSPKNF
jgi:type IX secretion system PorP/SprF family membrane protein